MFYFWKFQWLILSLFLLDFARERTEERDERGCCLHIFFVCFANFSEKIRFFQIFYREHNVRRNKQRKENPSSSKFNDWKQHNKKASHDRMTYKAIVEDCDESIRNKSQEFSHAKSLSQAKKLEMINRKSRCQKPEYTKCVPSHHEDL